MSKENQVISFYSPRHTNMEKTGQEQKIPAKCLGLLKDIFWREKKKKKKEFTWLNSYSHDEKL